MRKTLFILTTLLIIFSASAGNEEFLKKEFIYKGDTLRYRVLFPENYNKDRKYPLVLFLHGAGERGNDNESQLKYGTELFLDSMKRMDYPAIVIYPQCPANDYWIDKSKVDLQNANFEGSSDISQALFLVKKLLDSYKKNEFVDKRRIYVMGLSMGGMGTYDLICRYPKYFAAAIPICGAVETKRLKKVKKMPIRIFHGGADKVVSREFSRNAYIELKAEGSTKAEYVEFSGIGHDCWTKAFIYPDFIDWLFYQTR